MQTPLKPEIKSNKIQDPDTTETMYLKSTSSSPEYIAEELLEFEGITTFAPSPSPMYRYSMTLKSGKLRIWLEDCDSKNQWCTTQLSMEDYVDSTNAIPNATASDYVTYFHELLDGGHDGDADIPIKFLRYQEETFRLEVTVKIHVMRQSRVTTYVLDLEPISLERVDVLEAKMRDLQDEMEKLRQSKKEVNGVKVNGKNEVEELKKELSGGRLDLDTTISFELKGDKKSGAWIVWGASHIVQPIPGTYQVMVTVNYQDNKTSSEIKLVKSNKTIIQSALCGVDDAHGNSSSLVCITRVVKGEFLTLGCDASLKGCSYITLVRIGN